MKALLAMLLVGCASQYTYTDQTTINSIQPLPSVTMELRDTPTKPQVKVVEDHVELNKQGMVDLVNLYRDAKVSTNERNQLVLTLNKVIDERNSLLITAQQEEKRANSLGQQLKTESDKHASDTFWNNVELNLTRAVAIAIAIY